MVYPSSELLAILEVKHDRIKEKGMERRKADLNSHSYKHTCGAEDDRECSMMRHQILAEVHKSNVPIWVAEELEKRLYCQGCWNAVSNL